jgi:pilus assembly protein Flp/PilA
MPPVRLAFEHLTVVFLPQMMILATDEGGQDLIEYALVAALIALGAVTAIKGLSGKIANTITAVGSGLTSSA